MQQKRTVKQQILINIATGLVAVGLLIWLVDSGRLDFGILLSAPLSILHLLGLLALLVNMLLQAVRWWRLLRIHNTDLSLWEAIQLSWIGQFLSLVLPGAAGGELARAYYITRDAPAAKVAGVSTVLLDRVLGLYALLWLGISSLLVLTFQNELTSTVMQMGALILLLVISTSVFSLALWLRSTRDLILSFTPGRFRAPLEATLDSYRGHGKDLFGGFTLSLLANIVLMGVFLLSSQIIGTPLKWQQILLVGPLVIVANSLPISPGGIGVAETTASGLFAQFGVGTGATIMLIIRLGILPLRLPGGLIYVLRTGTWTSTQPGEEAQLDTMR